jgi:hypothetical protein
MSFAFDISCSGCGFRQLAGLSGHSLYYWLGGDRYAPVQYAPAWCGRCAKVALAEEVPTTEELARRRDWWLNWLRERGGAPGEEFYDRKAREWGHLADWRRRRVGPTRCLLCRSDAVCVFDPYHTSRPELPHPGCGGRLRFADSIHYHTRAMLVYSVEGEFLGFGKSLWEEFRPPKAPLPPAESGLWWCVDFGTSKPPDPPAAVAPTREAEPGEWPWWRFW